MTENKLNVVGISAEAKNIIDVKYKEKGFKTRSEYISHLVLKDNEPRTE